MRDPDLERRVADELVRWVDRTGRTVVVPDVEQIHRRADTRTVRGIAVTFTATAVAGLVLGAAVIGVGGIGMRDGMTAGRPAAPPAAIAGPAPVHPPAAVSGAAGRPPLTLRLAFRAGTHDARGCRSVRRVDRALQAPTPRSVVRAVLDGPTATERGSGVHSVYGRGARTTSATVTVDRARRVVTVDLGSLAHIDVSPAACRRREIHGPVLDALGQYDPRWSVRFTVRGDPAAVSRYVNGS